MCHIDETGKLLCKTACPLVNAMKQNINVTEKVYPLHKNKKRFPTITNISPITNNKGIVVGAIEVFRDVSQDEDYRILQEKFNRLVQKYISNNTYDEIINQLDNSDSETNMVKELSILYIDIVDFTSISELMLPSEVAELLNDFFGICDIITRETHGDIDKFIGDAVMATFIDANDAVLAAMKILEALKDFNKNRKDAGLPVLKIRIGINTGEVIQVEVGTDDRKDFTVIGDTVNTASRIQGIAEPNTIYITEQTLLNIRNKKLFSFVGEKELKGKDNKIKVWKINA